MVGGIEGESIRRRKGVGGVSLVAGRSREMLTQGGGVFDLGIGGRVDDGNVYDLRTLK